MKTMDHGTDCCCCCCVFLFILFVVMSLSYVIFVVVLLKFLCYMNGGFMVWTHIPNTVVVTLRYSATLIYSDFYHVVHCIKYICCCCCCSLCYAFKARFHLNIFICWTVWICESYSCAFAILFAWLFHCTICTRTSEYKTMHICITYYNTFSLDFNKFFFSLLKCNFKSY